MISYRSYIWRVTKFYMNEWMNVDILLFYFISHIRCLVLFVSHLLNYYLLTYLLTYLRYITLEQGRGSVVKYGGQSRSGEAIKLFQVTPYVNDFQTLINPGSGQPVGALRN